jgi:hypothetical protein
MKMKKISSKRKTKQIIIQAVIESILVFSLAPPALATEDVPLPSPPQTPQALQTVEGLFSLHSYFRMKNTISTAPQVNVPADAASSVNSKAAFTTTTPADLSLSSPNFPQRLKLLLILYQLFRNSSNGTLTTNGPGLNDILLLNQIF